MSRWCGPTLGRLFGGGKTAQTIFSCRFLVECRYSKRGGVSVAMTTAEFRVKMDSSPIPSVIFSNGIYAVELRIATGSEFVIPSQNEMYFWTGLALLNINVLLPCPPPTDETYTSYLPTNSMPLERLLGTKVFLELNLISPFTEVVLKVNYCLAFPRSARNALVFIYNGSA